MNTWINVDDRLPKQGDMVLIAFGPERTRAIATYYDSSPPRWIAAIDGNIEYVPTHWMPLPGAPPCESSFEKWWRSLPTILPGDEWRIVGGNSQLARHAAKAIWNAAISAFQREDFVK